MDELWARAALVAAALAVAGLVVVLRRRRGPRPVRDLGTVELGEGVYLFSSASCPTCIQARSTLDTRLGDGGYTELSWEQEAPIFADLGVDAVPAVVIVDVRGRARLYPGQPERALDGP